MKILHITSDTYYGDGLLIGRLGNITPWKRPLDFIRAIPRILDKSRSTGIPLKFLLADSSHENPQRMLACLREAQKNGSLSKIVVVTPAEDKFGLLNALDIFLYPTSRETYCVSIAEAMACGLPVVTYRESAMPEVVGDAGMLGRVGDIDALADNVVSLIESVEKRRSLSQRARDIVKSRNAPEVIAGRYAQIYRSVHPASS
jgi:glycosyltransferase involved in cell wall biosynthesis